MLTRDIAKTLAGQLDGDGAIEIERLVHPAQATGPSDLALAINTEALVLLSGCKAHAIVVSAANPVPSGSFRAIISIDGGRLALAKLTALFDPGPRHEKGIHPNANIAPDAKLGAGVSIGAYAVIGPGSHIGDGTTILPHVTIGADVTIGTQGVFHSGVRVGDRTIIGSRVIVHGNSVIGSDGFSYAPDLNSATEFVPGVIVTRIHSLGIVEIADDVEIGACTTIDRATLDATRIGSGTKIDNHVHIGHNVIIGKSCLVCGKVGIAGSVTIGDRVRLGGGAGIGDHLRIGDAAVVGAGSMVAGNVEAGNFVSGVPAVPHQRAIEQFLYTGRLRRTHQKVEALIERLDALEQTNKK